MDKEKIEKNLDADLTGYSEEEEDKAVDMAPGQWTSVSGKTVFSKKQQKAKTD